jgi:hypothetical protein
MMTAPAGLTHRQHENTRSSEHADDATLARRLAAEAEFVRLPRGAVERCVADVSACVAHLGMDATPALVERIVRAHLVGMVKSEPPSGR